MRLLLFVFMLVISLGQASAKITINAEYHPPTDLFALMDGISRWGFNDSAYHDAWAERFGWSRDDRAITRFYRRYRDRTYFDRAQVDRKFRADRDGIFAARSSFSVDTDPLAEHFIKSPTIQAVLSSLDNIASAEDAKKLRMFYEHFRPKWQLLLNESKAFASSVQDLTNG